MSNKEQLLILYRKNHADTIARMDELDVLYSCIRVS
jgi:hypothetical protein